MNEKIFLRSRTLTDTWIAEKGKYTKEENSKAFEKYILALAEKEYRTTAEQHIELGANHYLENVCNLIENLDNASAVDIKNKNILFEMLVVTCTRPELFFKESKQQKSNHPRKTQLFEESIQELYQKWDIFINNLSLCQHYIDRGTISLNRNVAKIPLNFDEMTNLAKEIDAIYTSYYFHLSKSGYKSAHKPSFEIPTDKGEDRNKGNLDIILLENCINKPWLYPLAHIILIRNAQYKMMGKVKYKKMELLNSNSKQFDLGKLTPEERSNCADITEEFSLRIRQVLEKFTLKKCKSNLKEALSSYFWDKYQKGEQGQEKYGKKFSSLYSIPNLKEHAKICCKISTLESEISSVPNCSIDLISLKVARKFSLDITQFQQLKKVLPTLFWGKSPISSVLKNIQEIPDNLKKGIEEYISPLRTLLNPREYFPTSNVKNENATKVSKGITNAVQALDSHNSKNGMEKVWSVYQDEIFFFDLTLPALFLSKAIQAPYCPNHLLPEFLRLCKKNLREALKQYKSKDYKKKLFQISKISKDKLVEIEMSDAYSELRKYLFRWFAGINNAGNLSWDNTKKFFRNISVIESSPRGANPDNLDCIFSSLEIKDNLKIEHLVKTLDNDMKKHICIFSYSKLIDPCIAALENKVLEVLVTMSLDIFRDSYSKHKERIENEEKSSQ